MVLLRFIRRSRSSAYSVGKPCQRNPAFGNEDLHLGIKEHMIWMSNGFFKSKLRGDLNNKLQEWMAPLNTNQKRFYLIINASDRSGIYCWRRQTTLVLWSRQIWSCNKPQSVKMWPTAITSTALNVVIILYFSEIQSKLISSNILATAFHNAMFVILWMIQTSPSYNFNEVVRVTSGLIKPKRQKTTVWHELAIS